MTEHFTPYIITLNNELHLQLFFSIIDVGDDLNSFSSKLRTLCITEASLNDTFDNLDFKAYYNLLLKIFNEMEFLLRLDSQHKNEKLLQACINIKSDLCHALKEYNLVNLYLVGIVIFTFEIFFFFALIKIL